MKALWNALAVMALANLIALAGFGAWLAADGRLDRERVQRVRSIFVETVSEERERLAQEEADRVREDAAEAAEAKEREGVPVSSMDAMSLRVQLNADEEQRLERLRKEVRQMQETLARERRKIDADLEQLEAREKAFAALQEQIRQTEGNRQFKKAVAALEGLEAADAMKALGELVQQGEMVQVVEYLNAMQDRNRTTILTEFIAAGQTGLAAELLERLRTRGMEVAAGRTAGPARTAAAE